MGGSPRLRAQVRSAGGQLDVSPQPDTGLSIALHLPLLESDTNRPNTTHVLLVDDVLYTGRSVHAAMSALQQFGRPARIDLLSLVDRRFNRHFPIRTDFLGLTVDAIDEAYVKVEWSHIDGKDQIKLFSKKESS